MARAGEEEYAGLSATPKQHGAVAAQIGKKRASESNRGAADRQELSHARDHTGT
jgi:hypothetical protein